MTLVKSFAITSPASASAAWRISQRVEKICLSNKLDGERHSARQQDDFASAKQARTKLSRSETADVVPQWDQQILIPTFVAQVLGQIAESGPDISSALLAYRNGPSEVALVYNRKA